MRSCLQAIAFLITIVFVVTAVFALIFVNLAQTVTDRNTVKEALDLDSFIEEVGPPMLVEALQEAAQEQGVRLEGVDPVVLQDAINEIIPSDWTGQQFNTTADSVYDFLENGEIDSVELEVDPSLIVERLRGKPGKDLVTAVLENLPSCPDPQPAINLESGNLDIPGCMPTNVPVELAAQIVHSSAVKAIDENPGIIESAGNISFSLFDRDQLTTEEWDQLQRIRFFFQLGQGFSWLIWLIPAFSLILITFLAVRSASDWGYWWGWPLLISGIITLGLAFLVPASFLAVGRIGLFNMGTTEMSQTINQLIAQFWDSMLDLWLQQVYLQASMMAGAGILLIIIGFITRDKRV